MPDEQPKTTSGAIFNPRSAGTTGIGSNPPVPVAPATAKRPSGGADRVILLLFTLLVLSAAGFMLYRLEQAAVVDPVKRAERGEVTAASDVALTQPANLSRALAALDDNLPQGGYVESFRLAPDRINAIVVDPDGLRRLVAINPGLELASSDAGSSDSTGLDPSEISPDVPASILAGAAKRYGLQPANLDYMVTVNGTDPSWVAYWKKPLKDNGLVAQLDGSQLRRVGEPLR